MTTSGTIDGTLTARQLCELAAKDLGVYGAGESLDANDAADMLQRLQWMLKSWQADGVNLWRQADATVVFPDGTKTVELDPYCLDVMEARRQVDSAFLLPLQPWEIGQYKSLPNPDQSGFPIIFYLSRTPAALSMTLWPVPERDTTIRYSYARVIEDVTNLNQTLDIPTQWLETVWTGLAVRCATMFGATRTDPTAVQLIAARAAILEQKMMDADRPASIFMGSAYGRKAF